MHSVRDCIKCHYRMLPLNILNHLGPPLDKGKWVPTIVTPGDWRLTPRRLSSWIHYLSQISSLLCLHHNGAAFRVANESLLKRSLRIFKSPSGIDTPGYPLHSFSTLTSNDVGLFQNTKHTPKQFKNQHWWEHSKHSTTGSQRRPNTILNKGNNISLQRDHLWSWLNFVMFAK